MTLLSVKLLVEWLETWGGFHGDIPSSSRLTKIKQDTQEYVEKYGYIYDEVNRIWTKEDPSQDSSYEILID